MAYQFSQTVTVTSTTSYPTDPQVNPGLTPANVVVQNRGDSTYYVSFDGVNDHIELQAGESITLTPKVPGFYQKLWARDGGGGSSAAARISLYA